MKKDPARGAGTRLEDGRAGAGSVLIVVEQLRRPVPGGIGTYARGLLQGLTELQAAGEPVPTVTPWASRLPGPLATRAWDRGWLGAPRRRGVVHAVSLAFPPVRQGPLVVTVHDLAWRQVPDAFPPRGRRWHEAALARAIRQAVRFVVPSEDVAGDLVRAGARPDAVVVVGEGSDHLPPPDHVGAGQVLARFGVRGPYLLSVGTNEPRKNLVRLIDAYASARSAMPDLWPLLVVGPRGWGGVPEPSEGVVMVGPVEVSVLAALYAGALLFVYVPLAEGFGLPPLEAMRAGAPVLASPVPSIGDAARLVDPLDVGAIAEGIRLLSTDEDARQALIDAGHRWAEAQTWRSAARRHVRLWDEVA